MISRYAFQPYEIALFKATTSFPHARARDHGLPIHHRNACDRALQARPPSAHFLRLRHESGYVRACERACANGHVRELFHRHVYESAHECAGARNRESGYAQPRCLICWNYLIRLGHRTHTKS